jgi:hypothetical protein
MRWFEAPFRRATPKGQILHLPHSTASRDSVLHQALLALRTHSGTPQAPVAAERQLAVHAFTHARRPERIDYCDELPRRRSRLTRIAVHKNRTPPIANHGFQRARLQRLSSGPTVARMRPASVARRTSSVTPRMTRRTPTTARTTLATRDSRPGAIPPLATMMSAIPVRRRAATPNRPNTTKPAGRRSASSRPADEARPAVPPTAQNRCTAANTAHHVAAPTAGTLHAAAARSSTNQQRPPSARRSDSRIPAAPTAGKLSVPGVRSANPLPPKGRRPGPGRRHPGNRVCHLKISVPVGVHNSPSLGRRVPQTPNATRGRPRPASVSAICQGHQRDLGEVSGPGRMLTA